MELLGERAAVASNTIAVFASGELICLGASSYLESTFPICYHVRAAQQIDKPEFIIERRFAMLALEKYTANDYPLYPQLVFNEQTMNMNLGRVFTDDEADLFFQMVLRCNMANADLGFYKVLAKQGKDIQYIGMGALNWNDDYNAIEIEYMLLPQYWNQGHGTELVKLLLQTASEARPELDIVAITDPGNIYSKKLLQRAGFTFVRQYVNDDGELAELHIKRSERASKQ